MYRVVFLLFASFSLLFSKAQLDVYCNETLKIYLNSKSVGVCKKDKSLTLKLNSGRYTLEAKKTNKDGSYKYYKKEFKIKDAVQNGVFIETKLIKGNQYYLKCNDLYELVEFIKKIDNKKLKKRLLKRVALLAKRFINQSKKVKIDSIKESDLNFVINTLPYYTKIQEEFIVYEVVLIVMKGKNAYIIGRFTTTPRFGFILKLPIHFFQKNNHFVSSSMYVDSDDGINIPNDKSKKNEVYYNTSLFYYKDFKLFKGNFVLKECNKEGCLYLKAINIGNEI